MIAEQLPLDQIDQPDQGRTDRAPRRVAVISVHGAAHHDPGETANAIADLLLSLPSFNPKQADKPCEEQEPRTLYCGRYTHRIFVQRDSHEIQWQ